MEATFPFLSSPSLLFLPPPSLLTFFPSGKLKVKVVITVRGQDLKLVKPVVDFQAIYLTT